MAAADFLGKSDGFLPTVAPTRGCDPAYRSLDTNAYLRLETGALIELLPLLHLSQSLPNYFAGALITTAGDLLTHIPVIVLSKADLHAERNRKGRRPKSQKGGLALSRLTYS